MDVISLDLIDQLMNKKKKNKEYVIDYKKELNDNQYKVVMKDKGNVLVLAGAGSGKTKTMTYRVARLIEDGIFPESILLLTFTKKAAKEMMQRASMLLDERCSKVNGGTYHGFCANILRFYGKTIGINNNFTILDSNDSEDAIDLIRTELKLNSKERLFPNKKTLQELFSYSVNKNISLENLLNTKYPEMIDDLPDILNCFLGFKEFKKNNSLLDYDDLLLKTCELLESSEKMKIKISNKYKFIMVDEYQDSNKLQSRLLKLLNNERENVFIFGDPSQSIYGFRGAHIKNILEFENEFKNVEVIKLNQNYRSIQPILDLSNNIMENATENLYNPLISNIEGIQKPKYIIAEDDYKQSKFIAQQILMLREKGVSLNDICVLIRNAYLSNNLEFIFNTVNIPYIKIGGIKFLEKSHIKDVLSYLRIITNQNDLIGWIRALQLFEGIGKGTANKISQSILKENNYIALLNKSFKNKKYTKSIEDLYNLICDLYENNLEKQLELILDFYLPIMKDKYDDFEKRKEDLLALKEITNKYKDAETFLTEVVLNPTETSCKDEDGNVKEVVTISTIHSAKGLEWNTVFIMSCVDGIIPNGKSLSNIEEIEEERRLLYVAITRAKRKLYITRAEEYSFFGNYNIPEDSRFLKENNNINKYMDVNKII